MNQEMKDKIEKRRKLVYAAVRNQAPDKYRRVVELAHLALPDFIADREKAAAEIESAYMSLVAECLGLDV